MQYYDLISKISAIYRVSNIAYTVDFVTGFVISGFIGNDDNDNDNRKATCKNVP